MSSNLIWRAFETRTTHQAFLLGDDLGDQEVRTACGLSLALLSGEEVDPDDEVTCPSCTGGEKSLSASSLPKPVKRRTTRRVAIVRPAEEVMPIPYGIFQLDPRLTINHGPPERIRCCVRGCGHFLIPPSRFRPGEVCPEHGIRTHASATYSYQDPRRNTIVAPGLLSQVIRHPFKFESGRFGYERGEDMLSFNVFRAFQEAGCLHLIARLITGREIHAEPRLFLWGLELTDDSLRPWNLLMAARERFESRLPVKRPATEPDIALFQPSQFLILCEAKFCSENPLYKPGPRKDKQSLTKDELIAIYADPALQIIDREKAIHTDSIPYQLYRNMQFAEYMAGQDSPRTMPFLANLTRQGRENQTFERFFPLVRPGYADRAVHLFWEQLFVLAGLSGGRLRRLQHYLLTKTANLRPAFQLGYW